MWLRLPRKPITITKNHSMSFSKNFFDLSKKVFFWEAIAYYCLSKIGEYDERSTGFKKACEVAQKQRGSFYNGAVAAYYFLRCFLMRLCSGSRLHLKTPITRWTYFRQCPFGMGGYGRFLHFYRFIIRSRFQRRDFKHARFQFTQSGDNRCLSPCFSP